MTQIHFHWVHRMFQRQVNLVTNRLTKTTKKMKTIQPKIIHFYLELPKFNTNTKKHNFLYTLYNKLHTVYDTLALVFV